ncbi:putative DNA-invertase from lambdoid prophage Rac [Paraburkholderia sp. 35.1]
MTRAEQTTESQFHEIRAAGFNIEPRPVVVECVSGSVAAGQRKGLSKLCDRLEAGDVLVVTGVDRLGRNAMDVCTTVEDLEQAGIRAHCLALGGADLASAAGKMAMSVSSAVTEFERDLVGARTGACLARARDARKVLGRLGALSDKQKLTRANG